VIGTGPFAYRGRSGGTITLARHASYWGGPALLDSLQFVASTDLAPDDQVAALLEGDVDVISVPSTRRSLLGDAAGYTIVRSVDIGVSFIGLNLDISPLDRLEVRQALAMGLDRPSLVAPEAAGELQLAKGVLPPVLTGYNPEPKVLPCDPQAARARLKDAGYDERHPLPPIDFYTSISSSSWLTDHVRDQLADIGVTVRVHQVTWPELDGRITRGEAPMFTLSWVADVPDPDAFLYFLFRTGEPYNVCRFSDREVDSLLALGRRMVPGPERSAMYRRVEEQVLRLAPMIPLYHAESVYAISPGVEGLELSQFGFALAPFERVWIRQPLLAQQPSAEGTLR